MSLTRFDLDSGEFRAASFVHWLLSLACVKCLIYRVYCTEWTAHTLRSLVTRAGIFIQLVLFVLMCIGFVLQRGIEWALKYQSDNFIKLSLGSWTLAAARKAGRMGHILSDPSRSAYRALIGARQARHCVKKMDASLLLLQEPPIRTESSFWPPRRQMGCVMGCKVQAYMTGGSRWSDRRFPSDSLFTRLFVAGFDSCFLPVQPRLHCKSPS